MQGGKGYAKGFLFASLNMTEVRYPIVIDQFYCPQGNCPTKVSHTKNIVMPITQICCLKD